MYVASVTTAKNSIACRGPGSRGMCVACKFDLWPVEGRRGILPAEIPWRELVSSWATAATQNSRYDRADDMSRRDQLFPYFSVQEKCLSTWTSTTDYKIMSEDVEVTRAGIMHCPLGVLRGSYLKQPCSLLFFFRSIESALSVHPRSSTSISSSSASFLFVSARRLQFHKPISCVDKVRNLLPRITIRANGVRHSWKLFIHTPRRARDATGRI